MKNDSGIPEQLLRLNHENPVKEDNWCIITIGEDMRLYHNGEWDRLSTFVFGSNLYGIHGKGAALFARQRCGALDGLGVGWHMLSYAIPTKSTPHDTLNLEVIKLYVDQFNNLAYRHEDVKFFVTRIGCGLAGYSDVDIAPMFKNAPQNCILPIEWKPYVESIQDTATATADSEPCTTDNNKG